MAFAISILYLVTYYLTPETVFGPLAAYRIELILAALVTFVSLPVLSRSFLRKTPQTLALAGLAAAVFLSFLIAARWPGGAVKEVLGFIPNAFAYFLVCLHCNSKKKLQVLALMLFFVCLFVMAHGYQDQIHGFSEADTLQPGFEGSPYLLAMRNDAGEWFYRLRGLGEIHDPNDFAQLIVCTIPLMFLFWRPKQTARNFAVVLLPVCVLVDGVFLTHSRGALLALMTVAIFAARRRIGTVPALAIGAGLFAAAMALHFTGGRAISAESGSDRTTLWGESLGILKSHPVFGVGMNQMPEYTDSHHTAHNSLAVCAAELGAFGLYFWSLFLFPTLRNALAIASPTQVAEGVPIEGEKELFPSAAAKAEILDPEEINRLGRLLVLSLTGFLVAGWFLSRAFVVTLFMLGGMVEAVYEMALRGGMIAPRMQFARVARFAALLAFMLVLMMYLLLRTVNLTH